MTVAYSGDKGEPELVPSGQPPTFAADVTEISAWFQKGRSFRRASTQAALIAATGIEDNDLAVVDNIDGATFKYDGSGATWRMHGVADFASSSARDTAITTPAAGMLARSRDTDVVFRHNGAAWKEWDSDWISWSTVPTNLSVGTGGSAAMLQRYKWISGRLYFEYRYVLGTSGGAVTGNPTINLPMSVAVLVPNGSIAVGEGAIRDVSASATPAFTKANIATATTVVIQTYNGTVGNITGSSPITFAAGDVLAGGFWADPA